MIVELISDTTLLFMMAIVSALTVALEALGSVEVIVELLFSIIPAVGSCIILWLSTTGFVVIFWVMTCWSLTAVVLAVTIALDAETSVEVIVGSGCARLLLTFLVVGTDFFFAADDLVGGFFGGFFLVMVPSLEALEAAAPRRGR